MTLGTLAGAIGKGLFAGLVGTAAMTAMSTAEMKLRGRKPSMTPAKAAEKTFAIEPCSGKDEERLSSLVHWGYGTMWGAMRGLIAATGARGPAADALHFAAVWGTALVMLPAMKLSPPFTEWEPEEVGIDMMHHLVYAEATGRAYEFLDKH